MNARRQESEVLCDFTVEDRDRLLEVMNYLEGLQQLTPEAADNEIVFQSCQFEALIAQALRLVCELYDVLDQRELDRGKETTTGEKMPTTRGKSSDKSSLSKRL